MALTSILDVAAPAKLNLFLHVTGRRADGYHLLHSGMVLIDWADTLHFERRADGVVARHDLSTRLPDDDLCLRAARALRDASGIDLGVDISIDKCVPTGAGMGGGSSDAASTLLALNRLWRLHWPLDRLQSVGLSLGADVPFFLCGRNAVARGIGERLARFDVPVQSFAVVKPVAGLETRAVFEQLARAGKSHAAIVEGSVENGFGDSQFGSDKGLALAGTRNDLQGPAAELCNDIPEVASWLEGRFGNSRMTGSGNAVFARIDSGVGLPVLPSGWVGRTCTSLAVHPLFGWAAGTEQ